MSCTTIACGGERTVSDTINYNFACVARLKLDVSPIRFSIVIIPAINQSGTMYTSVLIQIGPQGPFIQYNVNADGTLTPDYSGQLPSPDVISTCCSDCNSISCQNEITSICSNNYVSFNFSFGGYIFQYTVHINALQPDINLLSTNANINVIKNTVFSALPPIVNTTTTLPNITITIDEGAEAVEVVSIKTTITDIFSYKVCKEEIIKTFVGSPIISNIYAYHPLFYQVVRDCCYENCDKYEPCINRASLKLRKCRNKCGSNACNLKEKVNELLHCMKETVDYKSVVSYAILVYIFSALLYGCFDVNSVRQNRYEMFITDLVNSRYNEFSKIFLDPQYGFVDFKRFFKC